MFKMKAFDGKNNLCGKSLLKIRKQNKLSQCKLADKMQLLGFDIDRHVIRRIENGERYITDIEIIAFCYALNITYEELIGSLHIYEDSIKNNTLSV